MFVSFLIVLYYIIDGNLAYGVSPSTFNFRYISMNLQYFKFLKNFVAFEVVLWDNKNIFIVLSILIVKHCQYWFKQASQNTISYL